jgi:hypothetical protein
MKQICATLFAVLTLASQAFGQAATWQDLEKLRTDTDAKFATLTASMNARFDRAEAAIENNLRVTNSTLSVLTVQKSSLDDLTVKLDAANAKIDALMKQQQSGGTGSGTGPLVPVTQWDGSIRWVPSGTATTMTATTMTTGPRMLVPVNQTAMMSSSYSAMTSMGMSSYGGMGGRMGPVRRMLSGLFRRATVDVPLSAYQTACNQAIKENRTLAVFVGVDAVELPPFALGVKVASIEGYQPGIIVARPSAGVLYVDAVYPPGTQFVQQRQFIPQRVMNTVLRGSSRACST